ncbi:MAG TPA: hypothetical protein VHO69_13860 [Phototrophicaceae bacterium]|nr:hypothetical protein [Phototrophicaceae bacterium]
MTLAERCYRLLLYLYPAAYRRQYGKLMAQLFRDQYREAHDWHPILGPVLLWMRVMADLVTSLIVEYRDSGRRSLMNPPVSERIGPITALVFLLPALVALLLLFNPGALSGEWLPYGVAALIGLGGYLLGRIGLIPRLKFWGGYTAGLLIYAVGFFAINIWSPFVNLGSGASRNGSITDSHTLHLIAGLAAIALLYLLSKNVLTRFRLVIAILALGFAARLVLNRTPGAILNLSEVAWMLGYAATALFVAVVGMRLTRGVGLLSLVAVTTGLGLQLTLFTIDEYQGIQLTLMILLGAFVPLIVCPAWLLLTQNWRVQKYGLLVIWTLMMLGLFAVPQLLWRPGRSLTINVILYYIGSCLPIWIGLWLALAIYERETPTLVSTVEPAIQGA